MVHPTHPQTNQHQQPEVTASDRQFVQHTSSEANRILLDGKFAIGFFSNLSDTEYAVTDLRSVGFPMNQTTLIANHFRRQDQFVGVDLRDHFEAADLGIPAEVTHLYQDRLSRGEYMMIVQGTEDELNHATSILTCRGIQAWQMYSF